MLDFVIKGGHIIDGSGSLRYRSDIGIQGDKISAIGKLDSVQTRRIIEADGRVVCPGFIDMHSHSDIMLLANPKHEPKVMQGVTTEVLGLDGSSYAPLSPKNLQMMRRYLSGLNGNLDIVWDWTSVSEFLSRFDGQVAVNVVYLVPHNALRLETIGFVDRIATARELTKMQELLEQGINEGARGFSTGLDYYPARYCNIEELIEICKVVAKYKGVSMWHVRSCDLGLIEAIKEVISVAYKTRVKVHFSHYAASGVINWGKAREMLDMVDKAREDGLDVTFDSYPYVASSTTMIYYLPRWVHEGGPDAILERLSEPKSRERISEYIRSLASDWDRIFISCLSTEKNGAYIGKSVADAANMAGKDVSEFVCDLLLAEDLFVGYTNFSGNEKDIITIMQHICHTASSDGILVGDKPNPRGWGTFARYLGVYSRKLGVLSMEEVIRHMTSAATQCLGITDRGLVREGLFADLVIFDPQTIIDRATFDVPKKYPSGIEYVFVNGALVVEKGNHTGALNGRSLLNT